AETDEALYEIVNPEIVSAEGGEVAIEGCLSIPGLVGEVERASSVTVTGLDRDGKSIWVDGDEFLSRVLQHEIDHLDGVLFVDKSSRLYESEPEPDKFPPKRFRVVFMGTPEIAVPCLISILRDGHEIAAVVTQPDRRKGRGLEFRPSPVKEAATRHRLPVVQPDSCKSPEFIGWMRRMRPDVVVVVAFGRVLPREVLEIPEYGCINVHASLLPRYRGAAPINRAVMNGETVTGVTTMYLSERLDAGDVILQRQVPVSPGDDAGSLEEKLKVEGAELLVQTLRLIGSGSAPRIPQDESRATYAPMLTLKDEVIDWNRTPEEVSNQVRGMSPRPGAHTVRGGSKIKVFRCTPVTGVSPGGSPGEVLRADERSGLIVAVSGGAVRIEEVQAEGGKRMPITDFLRGARIRPGEILG
ncbi:MAG: methionyl-tRNA formyltransferase, partial [Firmicutes bacterium]|nr:methionyl-tRNA formyltransferase [Bacillota bacterium]